MPGQGTVASSVTASRKPQTVVDSWRPASTGVRVFSAMNTAAILTDFGQDHGVSATFSRPLVPGNQQWGGPCPGGTGSDGPAAVRRKITPSMPGPSHVVPTSMRPCLRRASPQSSSDLVAAVVSTSGRLAEGRPARHPTRALGGPGGTKLAVKASSSPEPIGTSGSPGCTSPHQASPTRDVRGNRPSYFPQTCVAAEPHQAARLSKRPGDMACNGENHRASPSARKTVGATSRTTVRAST